jgi:hypothetical protein
MPLNLLLEDVEKDIERWLAIHGTEERLSDGQVCIRGYDTAKAFVVNLYFEKNRLKELVAFVLKGYKDAAFVDRLTKQLIEQANTIQLKRLWAYLTGEQRMTYWQVISVRDFFPGGDGSGNLSTAEETKAVHQNNTIPQYREATVAMLRSYEQILTSIDLMDGELPFLREEIELIASGSTGKTKKKALSDKIDEERFWLLIKQAKSLKEEAEPQVYQLVLLLEQYSGPQIKNFQRILDQKLDHLNRWDVWALAYLAQDGCSDDAFESFRAWLVLQGSEVCQKVLSNVDAALSLIPGGGGTKCDSLLHCGRIAYERREGKCFTTRAVFSRVKGTPWREENVAREFPEIASHYGRY